MTAPTSVKINVDSVVQQKTVALVDDLFPGVPAAQFIAPIMNAIDGIVTNEKVLENLARLEDFLGHQIGMRPDLGAIMDMENEDGTTIPDRITDIERAGRELLTRDLSEIVMLAIALGHRRGIDVMHEAHLRAETLESNETFRADMKQATEKWHAAMTDDN